MGDYGWYKEKVGEALATKRALAKNFSRNADTLYVHADTLRLFSYDLRTDSAYRVLHGYFHVRAYRTDVQAVCDSLVFHSKLRKLSLYRDPIAWSDDRQILGEEINVYTNDSTLDSVYVERQALIVQQLPDTVHFNQVSGNMLQAYFTKGQLYQARVNGNAMVINPDRERLLFALSNYCEAAKNAHRHRRSKNAALLGWPFPHCQNLSHQYGAGRAHEVQKFCVVQSHPPPRAARPL